MATESYSNFSTLKQYYGNSSHPGAQIPFNFGFIEFIDFNNIIDSIDKTIHNWMEIIPENGYANWVVRIHLICIKKIQYYFICLTSLIDIEILKKLIKYRIL